MFKFFAIFLALLSTATALQVDFMRKSISAEQDPSKNHLIKISGGKVEWLKDIINGESRNMLGMMEINYFGKAGNKRTTFHPCDRTSANDIPNLAKNFFNKIFLGGANGAQCPIKKQTYVNKGHLEYNRQASYGAACVEKAEVTITVYEKDPKGGTIPGTANLKGWTKVATAVYEGQFTDC